MQNFLICLNSIAPIFILIGLGVLLKKVNIIDDNFTDKASDLIFKVVLPLSLFWDIATSEIGEQFDPRLVIAAVIATISLFVLGLLVSKTPVVSNDKSRAAVAQGVFRSNYAILGMPLTKAIFDSAVAVNASVILVICIPIFNVLSVVLIEYSLNRKGGIKKTIMNIVKNPLIIGAVAGGIFSLLKIPVPSLAATVISYVDSMCMPLAFIVIGGSMIFERVKESFVPALVVSVIRTFLAPAIFTTLAFLAGIDGEKLGVLFIFLASPAAISGYIMMRKMGGDYDLAGNIVLISTILCFFSILFGISLMKTWGLF